MTALFGQLASSKVTKIRTPQNVYTAWSFNIGEHQIAVMTPPQMGNADAGIITQQAIDWLSPTNVILLGIAAGIKNKVKLGNVVIADTVFYYEIAKVLPDGKEARYRVEKTDTSLLERARYIDKTSWRNRITAVRPQAEISELISENDLQIHFGAIATGEKVINSQAMIDELTSSLPPFSAMEMEGYGVARAVVNHTPPPRLMIIRGISDYGVAKDDVWRHYAASSAAACAVEFIEAELSNDKRGNPYGIDNQQQHRPYVAIRHQSLKAVSAADLMGSLEVEKREAVVEEICIDQIGAFSDNMLLENNGLIELQANLETQLTALYSEYADLKVFYYGLPHVPLAFLVGRQLEKFRLEFYEIDRYSPGHYWPVRTIATSYPEISSDHNPEIINLDKGDVILRISVTREVGYEYLDGLPIVAIGSAHMYIKTPSFDVVVSEDQLHNYKKKFRQLLEQLHISYPNAGRIHIFYAGPVSLAVCFGQQINPRIDIPIFVYNYDFRGTPKYSWGIQVSGAGSPQLFKFETAMD